MQRLRGKYGNDRRFSRQTAAGSGTFTALSFSCREQISGSEYEKYHAGSPCAIFRNACTFCGNFAKAGYHGQILKLLYGSSTHSILNRFLSLKFQNFAVKSKSENRFTFVQKNSEYATNKEKKISENGKNLSV